MKFVLTFYQVHECVHQTTSTIYIHKYNIIQFNFKQRFIILSDIYVQTRTSH